MRKIKSTITITIISLLSFILSGCWDNKDINHRVMPVVLGISKENEKFNIFLQIPQPTKDTIKTEIVIETGNTVNEAVDKISANMESSVDLHHVKVIIIEEELAEEGLKDLFSGFMRSTDVSSRAIVAICSDDFDQFFSKIKQSEQPEGTDLLDYFEKDAGWTPHVALTRVWQVYRSIHSYTRDVAIPILRMGETTLVEQVGSAVIKNGKMVDHIDSEETLLFNAFNDQSTQGKISVMNNGSVLIIGNTMEHESKFINGVPFLKSKLKLKVTVLETKGNPSDEELKLELEMQLKTQFDEMFTKLQTNKADILGIGQFYRNKISRKELKNWRTEYYPKLSLNFQVLVDIQNSGDLKLRSD
ncbi:Ger(x)C family spore germination protein [Viridibacillus arvi]|uniref:Ger(x)C family spore germination protein n=1 Tax=Viridibacillus arvi TaxID=263475 RepID=UPI0034CE9FED